MQRPELLLLLSAFGLVIPACAAPGADVTREGSSMLEEDPAVASYLESKAFAALGPLPAPAVKAALAAAPGPIARGAILDLFRTPKWLMLGSVTNLSTCAADGPHVQVMIAEWVKAASAATATESAASTDARAAASVFALKSVLIDQDVRDLTTTLANLAQRLATATPPFTNPTCGGGTATTNNGCNDTTNGCGGGGGGTTNSSNKQKTHASTDSDGNAPAAARILGDMFAQVDLQMPSRGMAREWTSLRSTYRSSIARSAPSVRAILLEARRSGSATLARSDRGRAVQKFDQGALMVDQFVRQGVRFTADSMRVVHAVVADESRGEVRTAGQDVSRGKNKDHLYLPGSQVDAAVAKLFQEVHQRTADSSTALPQVAAAFDQRMISIHPFMDANGRTTRLMTDWLLATEGYPPVLASRDAISSALFWQTESLEKQAHLERITDGMRRTVDLVTSLVG